MARTLTLALALLTTSTAAQDAHMLRLSTPVDDSITTYGQSRFVLEAPAESIVYGTATQHTVDVVLTIERPDGTLVTEVDQTARGAEPFQFIADVPGTYRIEVSPYTGTGRFTLAVEGIEPVATTPFGRIDQHMRPFRQPGTPGGVLAVIERGEVTDARAYGEAILTHGVPITTETVFNIGSVAKQFTGAAFAILAEEGVLSLDDEAREYLPELPDFGTSLTLRHLLNHTSGLRESYGTAALSGRNRDEDLLTRQGVLDIVSRQPELQFSPGSEMLYNSSAYVLLTTILERVTGQGYPDWMDTHVFGPLGMTNTSIEREVGQVIPGAAMSYVPGKTSGWVEVFDNRLYYGATDIYSTVGDLARWLDVYRTSALGEGVRSRMLEKSVLTDGDSLDYTLGLYVTEQLGHPALFHSGGTGGYRSTLVYFPEADAGVVVLANTPGVDYQGLADILAETFLDLPEELKPSPEVPESDDTGVQVNRALLAAYSGSFIVDGLSVVLTFKPLGGTLAVRTGDSPEYVTLRALTDSTFMTPDQAATLTFRRATDGSVSSGAVERGTTFSMRRVEAWSPSPDELETYIGDYKSDEVGETYQIEIEEGVLVVRHRWLGRVPLRPEGADHFAGEWPLTTIAFKRSQTGAITTGAITGFSVSNGRTRGIQFKRLD